MSGVQQNSWDQSDGDDAVAAQTPGNPSVDELIPLRPLTKPQVRRWRRFGVDETLELSGQHFVLKRRVGSGESEAVGKSETWEAEMGGGHRVFVKRFLSPKFPDDDLRNDPKFGPLHLRKCHQFEQRHQEVMDRLTGDRPGSGAVIKPFLFGRPTDSLSYVKVYPWLSDAKLFERSTVSSWTPANRLIFLRTLFLAIWELHSRGVAHGDIKRQNILVVDRPIGPVARLIDLDEAFLSDRGPSRFEDLDIGTDILAPEWKVLENPEISWRSEGIRLGSPTDMFQLAVVLHEVLAPGQLEWSNLYDRASEPADASIMQGKPEYLDFNLGDSRVNEHVGIQLAHCLRRDPTMRPPIESLLSASGVIGV